MHPLKLHLVGRGSAVIPGVGQWVHRALEGYQLAFVNGIDDPCGGRDFLGYRCGSTQQCTGQNTEGKRTQETHSGFPEPFLGGRIPGNAKRRSFKWKKHGGATYP